MIRRGVSAIIFFEDDSGKKEYLLLKRKQNWKGWEFLKGGRKKNESEAHCLKREIKEEIGISKFKAKKTKFVHSFKYQKEYMKDHREWGGARNRIYLVEVSTKKIKLDSDEHSGFKWMTKQQVLKNLTWKDYKAIFRKLA